MPRETSFAPFRFLQIMYTNYSSMLTLLLQMVFPAYAYARDLFFFAASKVEF